MVNRRTSHHRRAPSRTSATVAIVFYVLTHARAGARVYIGDNANRRGGSRRFEVATPAYMVQNKAGGGR